MTQLYHLISSDAPEDFSNKIVELLNNPDMRTNLEKNAILLAKTYDWSLIGESQELVYKDVMSRRGL